MLFLSVTSTTGTLKCCQEHLDPGPFDLQAFEVPCLHDRKLNLETDAEISVLQQLG